MSTTTETVESKVTIILGPGEGEGEKCCRIEMAIHYRFFISVVSRLLVHLPLSY